MRRTQKKGLKKAARNITIKTRCPSKYRHVRLVQNILREWKSQTNGKGHIKRDLNTIYKCDYYLSLTNADNHNTHIHLIIRNFYKNSRALTRTNFVRKANDILGYCIKKQGEHSAPIAINIKQSPKFIVSTMLKQIKSFK